MRIVFMGAPTFAAPCLAALVDAGHDIAAVYTRAPKPAGRRGLNLAKTPIHLAAEQLGAPVETPATLRHEAAQRAFAAYEPDVAIVVAYGLILPRAILDAPRLGCLNLHASLLPRWRGAAPIQRAIMAGDKRSGVAVMRMEEGLDTGPIALEESVAIAPSDTAGELAARLSRIGAGLMVEALALLDGDALAFQAQAGEGVTYAHKIDKAETRIDWREGADVVRNRIHGLSPAPGAYSEIVLARDAERIKLLRVEKVDGAGSPGMVLDDSLTVACGRGAIRIVEAQRSGRQAMRREEFLRGSPIPRGARFIPSDAP